MKKEEIIKKATRASNKAQKKIMNKEIQKQDVNKDIEKAYPEAYRLARKFHELYEETAPKFGYKTRGDTKAFEPASPNGRTMAYVCKEIVDEELEKAEQRGAEKERERIREKACDIVGNYCVDENGDWTHQGEKIIGELKALNTK